MTQVNNDQILIQGLNNLQTEFQEAETLIDELGDLAGLILSLRQEIADIESEGGSPPDALMERLDEAVGEQNAEGAKLKALDPGFGSLVDALVALEKGQATVLSNHDANQNEDQAKFSKYLDVIVQAMRAKLIVAMDRKKMDEAGQTNDQLLSEALQLISATGQEGSILEGLKDEMSQDLVSLNNQKQNAETDLDSYHWYDYIWERVESKKSHDRDIIRNSDDMKNMIQNILKSIAPEIAATQSILFESASLTLEQILDEVKKLIAELKADPDMPDAANKIKYLMALALGVLAMIQSDAAQEKANDQKTSSEAGNFAVQMNLANEKAKLDQLENDLAYAKTMGTLMKIAKPLLEVGGCLLAPGVGSFIMMALLIVLDETGVTGKLTDELAKTALGSTGAQILVGAFEVIGTMGGGAALDQVMTKAVSTAMVSAAESAETTVAKVVEEAVDKAVAQAESASGKALSTQAQAEVRKVVSEAVNKAVQSAVEKTVIQFNNQAAATLIPQLVKAGTESMREGLSYSAGLATRIAAAAEKSCIAAAESAAKTASEDVSFLAEAAANGAKIAPQEIEAVSERAANEAVATVTKSTPEKVAAQTAEKSAMRKAAVRGLSVAAYVSLSDGALSNAVEKALKAAGKKDDDASFEKLMAVIKALEAILASLAVAYGTGIGQSVMMESSLTTLTKVGILSGLAGTAAQTISMAGQGEASYKQAGAVKAINEINVSNDMLQLLLKQYAQQGNTDRKHAESQLAEVASNYTMMTQLENNGKKLAEVLTELAV